MADYLTKCSDRVSEDDDLRLAATMRHNLNALTEWKKVIVDCNIIFVATFITSITDSAVS